MVFYSKRDTSFVTLIIVAIMVIAVVTILPMFLEDSNDLVIILTLLGTFFLSSGFILWASLTIKYVFYSDYLYIKGGPFRSKIPYDEITRVRSTSNMLIGYRILSSADGIEIFYKKALFGSVKISPEKKETFIKILQNKCPDLNVTTELMKK